MTNNIVLLGKKMFKILSFKIYLSINLLLSVLSIMHTQVLPRCVFSLNWEKLKCIFESKTTVCAIRCCNVIKPGDVSLLHQMIHSNTGTLVYICPF